MTPAQRKQLGALLETLEAELAHRSARRIEPVRTDETDVGGDEDEQPLAEMNQAIASNRNAFDAAVLKRVQAARARLASDPDDFGNCRDCGDEILFARLKAMPYAELCVDCQAKRDPRGRATRSKLTEFK